MEICKKQIRMCELMNEENVIVIENLVKEYKMFNSKKDRLLESLIPGYQKHDVFRAMNDVTFSVKKL